MSWSFLLKNRTFWMRRFFKKKSKFSSNKGSKSTSSRQRKTYGSIHLIMQKKFSKWQTSCWFRPQFKNNSSSIKETQQRWSIPYSRRKLSKTMKKPWFSWNKAFRLLTQGLIINLNNYYNNCRLTRIFKPNLMLQHVIWTSSRYPQNQKKDTPN